MKGAQFEKAKPEDFDDTIDFADFVFSHAHASTDFMDLLPKLYKPEYFMESIHYLAREGGKIKAAVGAYPLKIEFSGGVSIPGRGIGMVSVHPRSRSKGYMKALMNMALDDMKKDGMVFSCLGGLRQRYEYFGFTPAGNRYAFSVGEPNIRHTLGRDWNTPLSLRAVQAGDKTTLDRIQALHEAKRIRYYRNRDKLFDILSSWNAKTFALFEGGEFEGYIISKGGNNDISEINLEHPSRLCEALGLFLRDLKEKGNQNSLMVCAGPHETEKITLLSRFAESCRQSSAYHFNVFDFKRLAAPFMNFKAGQRLLAEGSFVLRIEGPSGGTYELCSRGGKIEMNESASPPDLILDPLEAIRFFFSPVSAVTVPKIGESVFLQSLLPLPLFFENADGV
jgi:predicted N-acetyltransferase YhbS